MTPDPISITDLSTGGILAVLLAREVFTFLAKRKNGEGPPVGIGEMVDRLAAQQSNHHHREEDVWSHLGNLVQEGDRKIALILENQTNILQDMMTLLATHHHSVEINAQDVQRRFTILSEDLLRRIDNYAHRST